MDNIYRLFEKYRNNQCSPEEIEELLAYFKLGQHDALLKGHIDLALKQQHINETDNLQADADEVYRNIQQQIAAERTSRKRPQLLKWLSAAAILLFSTAAAYFLLNKEQPAVQVAQVQHDLLPGTDKAILTIAGGKKIDVSDVRQGKIATQGSIAISKTADGRIVYKDDQAPAADNGSVYNTLTTPRGGQHMLVLSDGTKAWLDAASSITFPVAFTGNERTVTITGQVYFEVTHDAAKPFKVTADGQTIEVLGTHFNVKAYADEPNIKTTLLQGSVKITKNGESRLLVPGQQSTVAHGAANYIEVKTVDTDAAIAWHMGLFKFQEADIKAVMRELSRWYDVEVSYEGQIPNRHFSGEIYRNVNASKIAEILSYKKIHFRIEGKQIIVMP